MQEKIKSEAKKILVLVIQDIKKTNSPIPMFSFEYYKGYCKAVENIYKLQTGQLWEIVRTDACQLCHNLKIKSKSPLSHLISFQKIKP